MAGLSAIRYACATVKIESVALRRVRLPLVAPFRTSFGTETVRHILLVHLTTADSAGWGECVAMDEPLYSAEYLDGAQDVISQHLLPRLFRPAEVSATDVASVLAAVKGHRMSKAALEMAVLDAELRAAGVSFGTYLGAVHSWIPSGVSVGMTGSVGELLDAVDRYLAEGYRRVKLKIEPGWDVEPVRAVRERFGDDLVLQVDANSAYSLADAPSLARLDAFHLVMIEQPLPEDDLGGHANLARQIDTPICLDESIVSAQVAADAIAMGACRIVNIKPGRVGGYLEARRVHDVCAAAGVPVWCGGMLESGLARAGNVALAALENFVLPGDTSASNRYFDTDLTAPFVLEDGGLRVPVGPGLGVEPLPDVLQAMTTSVTELRPG